MSNGPSERYKDARTIKWTLPGSLRGTAEALKLVAEELRDRSWKTAVCLQSRLQSLEVQVDKLADTLKIFCSTDFGYRIDLMPIETSRALKTIVTLQNACDAIVKGARDIVQRYTIWDIVAPDHDHCRLQVLHVFIQRHTITLQLLMRIMHSIGVGHQYPVESDFLPEYQRKS